MSWAIFYILYSIFHSLYSTSLPTLYLVCLLILILLEFYFHVWESHWPFQIFWSVSHKRWYENPWVFQKEDGTAFLCYYYWLNELGTFFLGIGVGRTLHRASLLFIWHRLGNLIGNKCNNRRCDAWDGNWVCVNHWRCHAQVSQPREIMAAVVVAVVVMLAMLTMTAASNYWAMHCTVLYMECFVIPSKRPYEVGTIKGPASSLEPLVSHLTWSLLF